MMNTSWRTLAMKLCLVCLSIGVTGGATGCFWVTTKHEGDLLRTDVRKLDGRLAEREEDLAGKIRELQTVLDQATRVLQRNSADLGAEVQALEADMRTLQGLLAEAAHNTRTIQAQVEALEARLAEERTALEARLTEERSALEARIVELEKKAAEPTSPDELYSAGKAAYDRSDFPAAHKYLSQLVIRYPGHDRADDAQYYRGEAYTRAKDFDGAIREFQKVFDKYPNSGLADDSLFRAGEAAQTLRRCSEARAYFGLLRQKYTDSPLIDKAKAKDQQLRRDLKNKKKCVS